jgi:hypothetical protein
LIASWKVNNPPKEPPVEIKPLPKLKVIKPKACVNRISVMNTKLEPVVQKTKLSPAKSKIVLEF